MLLEDLKSLYGLKQAPRNGVDKLKKNILAMGYQCRVIILMPILLYMKATVNSISSL